MEKQKVTAEEFALAKEHYKGVVLAVFTAETRLTDEGKLNTDMTMDDYLGVIAEEILLSTYKINES